MVEHYNIGRVSNNCLCPFDIWSQYYFRYTAQILKVPEQEDRGLKRRASGIVETLQFLDRRSVSVRRAVGCFNVSSESVIKIDPLSYCSAFRSSRSGPWTLHLGSPEAHGLGRLSGH
jgi:hypothetical protein